MNRQLIERTGKRKGRTHVWTCQACGVRRECASARSAKAMAEAHSLDYPCEGLEEKEIDIPPQKPLDDSGHPGLLFPLT